MLALTLTQEKILSVFLILIFAVLIYLLSIFAIKNYKKSRKTNMLNLNMTIKYKQFKKYVEYQREEETQYILYLLSINNFKQLENYHKPTIISTYLKRVAKNISMYLPYGGKLAQTNQRETFVIYVSNSGFDPYDFGKQLKQAASEIFTVDGKQIQKAISISYITEKTNSLEKQFENLSYGLIESKRRLTEIVKYDESLITSTNDYNQIVNKLNELEIKALCYDVHSIKSKFSKEKYATLVLDNDILSNFIKTIPKIDQAWVNMWLIELILNAYRINMINGTITIPVTIQALEAKSFNYSLSQLIYINNFNPSEVIISISENGSTNLQLAIKNLLELKNLGFKLSYKVKEINNNVYQIVQSYHVDRLELNEELFANNNDILDEFLYFTKVNHLETLLKTEQNDISNYLDMNVTHILRRINEDFKLKDYEKKSGLFK